MFKKIITKSKTPPLLLGALLLIFCASSAPALSIGGEITGGLPLFYGGSLLVSLNETHHFGLGAVAKGIEPEPVLTLHWDAWFFDTTLSETVNGSIRFFIGPGIATAFLLRGSFSYSLTLRGLVGFDFTFGKCDIFVQLTSEVGAVLYPFSFPTWSLGGGLGARWRLGD